MNIVEGHVLVLNLPFANGTPCKYKRPFLVINKYDNILELLNVSSIKGKEKKLLYPSNEKIKKYFPPLDYPSFIKKDELYIIDSFPELASSIYKRRDPIQTTELSRLVEKYLVYRERHDVTEVKYIETTVKEINSL